MVGGGKGEGGRREKGGGGGEKEGGGLKEGRKSRSEVRRLEGQWMKNERMKRKGGTHTWHTSRINPQGRETHIPAVASSSKMSSLWQ